MPHCLAGFITVAAIMPEAMAGGKPGSGTAVMPPLRDPGRPANDAEPCYNVAMAKQRKPVTKGAKVSGFVVGRARFTKISAVEGIELTPSMEKRASEAGQKGLTAEEYRRTIVRSHRKD